MRKSNIPPGGSIPRQWQMQHTQRRHLRDTTDAASWEPHVIKQNHQQRKSLLPAGTRANSLRSVLEHVLAQAQQEYADLCAMAHGDEKSFNIGVPQYFSLLEKKIADLNEEIRNLL